MVTRPRNTYVSQSSYEQDQDQYENVIRVNGGSRRNQYNGVGNAANFPQRSDSSILAFEQDQGLSGFSFSPLAFAHGVFQDIPADFTMPSHLVENVVYWEDLEDNLNRAENVRRPREHSEAMEQPVRLESMSEEPSQDLSDSPHRRSTEKLSSPVVPPIELSALSKTTRKLLYHYQMHVCQLMMPTAAPSHNPWLKLYLPIALQEPTTAAKQALLHAILAVAAFNQAELNTNDPQSSRLQAVEHSEKAARLVKAIVSVNDHAAVTDALNKQALLAAALTMTTIEVNNHLKPFTLLC